MKPLCLGQAGMRVCGGRAFVSDEIVLLQSYRGRQIASIRYGVLTTCSRFRLLSFALGLYVAGHEVTIRGLVRTQRSTYANHRHTVSVRSWSFKRGTRDRVRDALGARRSALILLSRTR